MLASRIEISDVKHYCAHSVAQHAAVADAASRPQDRCVFESWRFSSAIPISRCGAAKRQPVGRAFHVKASTIPAMSFNKLDIVQLAGSEPFHLNGQALPFDVLAFWRWSSSALVSNAMRGVLAEYLVARDLGVAQAARVEWDAYDLRTQQGLRVEVKSAAYLQSWKQAKRSRICFDIEPKQGWNAETNEYSTERRRQADVYVFALLNHHDKATLDPLNLAQ